MSLISLLLAVKSWQFSWMPFPAFVCDTRVSQCCKNCPTPVLKECTLTCLRNALIFEFYEIQTQTGVCAARSDSWSLHADDRNGLKEIPFFVGCFQSIFALMGKWACIRKLRQRVFILQWHSDSSRVTVQPTWNPSDSEYKTAHATPPRKCVLLLLFWNGLKV